MVNKKEYVYEQKLIESVSKATDELHIAKTTQDQLELAEAHVSEQVE